VAEKLISHLLTNNLLYAHQYGFLPKRSTEQNLLQIVNYIAEAINENHYCIGVFLDLKKAFDVCSHEILLKKLKKMGINGKAHSWFSSYLQGRSQCVDIDGNFSEFLDLDISVIQGSTLGPLLFLCYINDFWTCTNMFSVLFADDTTGLAKGANLQELISYVNLELQKMANWFRSNKMQLNASKTKYIIFRTKNKYIDPQACNVVYNCTEIGLPDDPSLISPIERISFESNEKSFKLLGVLFDEYLCFKPHIEMLCSKISKSLFCLNRIKNFVNAKTLRMLYFSMVHSVISYGIIIYGCANKSNLEKLIVKQKHAIRTICNVSYRAHTAPLFKQQKILPIEKLIQFSSIKLMHSFHFRQLPLSFADTWATNIERNPARALRNANDLFIPPHRVEFVKRLPLYTLPLFWNTAPGNKLNPRQHLYLKELKIVLLSSI
jgi:hypothetical protein